MPIRVEYQPVDSIGAAALAAGQGVYAQRQVENGQRQQQLDQAAQTAIANQRLQQAQLASQNQSRAADFYQNQQRMGLASAQHQQDLAFKAELERFQQAKLGERQEAGFQQQKEYQAQQYGQQKELLGARQEWEIEGNEVIAKLMLDSMSTMSEEDVLPEDLPKYRPLMATKDKLIDEIGKGKAGAFGGRHDKALAAVEKLQAQITNSRIRPKQKQTTQEQFNSQAVTATDPITGRQQLVVPNGKGGWAPIKFDAATPEVSPVQQTMDESAFFAPPPTPAEKAWVKSMGNDKSRKQLYDDAYKELLDDAKANSGDDGKYSIPKAGDVWKRAKEKHAGYWEDMGGGEELPTEAPEPTTPAWQPPPMPKLPAKAQAIQDRLTKEVAAAAKSQKPEDYAKAQKTKQELDDALDTRKFEVTAGDKKQVIDVGTARRIVQAGGRARDKIAAMEAKWNGPPPVDGSGKDYADYQELKKIVTAAEELSNGG